MLFFIFLLKIIVCNSYNICIVGGSSNLGRELIYNGLNNNLKILALSNNPDKINKPYRGNGLYYNENNLKDVLKFNDNRLTIDNYNNCNKYIYDNLIFCLNARPFENDYSDIITKKILNNNNKKLKNIVLISAYGVGDSLNNSNLGIKIMNDFYLKDVYRSKNEQEKIILNYCSKNINVNPIIKREKALAYGKNLYGAKPRKQLAYEILSDLNLNRKY